ncbi:MAG: hypothetical protein AB1641_16925 [Thermodesulfobacteriota bacterium]
MSKKSWCGLLVALMMFSGCAGQEYRPVPIKSVESYPNHVTVFGAVIAAQVWSDRAAAQSAFGFDVLGAGLLPVQVIVDNKGGQTLNIVADQTMLLDREGNLWNILPAHAAYDRIDRQLAPSRVAGQGVKGGALGSLAGGILGAAFGVVTGHDIGQAIVKGAAAGAAVGAVKGGYNGLEEGRSKEMIARDLQARDLKEQPLRPQEISHGFLFFPAEVREPMLLRLKLRDLSSGQSRLLEMKIK